MNGRKDSRVGVRGAGRWRGMGLCVALLSRAAGALAQGPAEAPPLAAVPAQPAAPPVQAVQPSPIYVPSATALAPTAPALVAAPALPAPGPGALRAVRPPPPALGVTGQVESVSGMHAVVSIGSSEGLAVGSRIRFEPETIVASEWSDFEAADVVGEVEHVAGERALVALGMFETNGLRQGQRVVVTAGRPTRSQLAPPRPDGSLIAEAGVRAFLPVSRVSVGAISQLALTYLPAIPVFLRAELAPLAGRTGAGTDMGAYGAQFSFGYDQRFAMLGVGVGVVGYRDEVRVPVASNTFSGDRVLGAIGSRFAVSQLGRVGARDGLHGLVRPTFVLDDERWRFASLELAGQIPIGSRFALTPRFFIAPQLGLNTGELGFRMLARGNGGEGSLFLRPMVGFVGSFAEAENTPSLAEGALRAMDTLIYGPMAGVDVEFRL